MATAYKVIGIGLFEAITVEPYNLKGEKAPVLGRSSRGAF